MHLVLLACCRGNPQLVAERVCKLLQHLPEHLQIIPAGRMEGARVATVDICSTAPRRELGFQFARAWLVFGLEVDGLLLLVEPFS